MLCKNSFIRWLCWRGVCCNFYLRIGFICFTIAFARSKNRVREILFINPKNGGAIFYSANVFLESIATPSHIDCNKMKQAWLDLYYSHYNYLKSATSSLCSHETRMNHDVNLQQRLQPSLALANKHSDDRKL